MQIDILPAIDFSKSYPRGTFARYDGGFVRAFRNTIPGDIDEKSGWEVIVAGLSSIMIGLSDDYRTLSVTIKKTGENPVAHLMRVPVLLYKGVYKSGELYCRGDVTTWGGSAWHCQAEETKGQPGVSSDWVLMVKEGRKGKDGKDGIDGKQGPQGPRGMDAI